MFAYRWTMVVKPGCMEELVELHKSVSFRADYAKFRMYTPDISPQFFVSEMVVESDEVINKWFAEFNATAEAKAFWEKFNALTERMVSTERWNVIEAE